MALKINNKKKLISIAIWSLIGLLLAIFIIRTSIWEANYYSSEEGSERATAPSTTDIEIDEPEPVDETEVTEEQRVEYTVPADQARYLTIEKLGVYNARVLTISRKANKQLGTPNNIFDVGWYDGSAKPGTGGTLVIDGHNGGPHIKGVFKHTDTLVAGDIITITRGDGKVFRYSVVDNVSILLAEANKYMNKEAIQSPVPGKESVTLITCIGDWSETQQTYLSRQFTRAVLVE